MRTGNRSFLTKMQVFYLKVLGSQSEYHFVHRTLPHVRSKRSVPHMRRLKVDPLVSLYLFSFLDKDCSHF